MAVPASLERAIKSTYEELAFRDYAGFVAWLNDAQHDGLLAAEELPSLFERFPDPTPRRPPEPVADEVPETYIRDVPDPGPLARLEDKGWVTKELAEAYRMPVGELRRLLDIKDEDVVLDIQENALHIVGRCNDPKGWGENKRGLVYGMVQSGKTASMVSVIAVARRAGYRLFIILAGDKSSLRDQTQARVNKAFQLANGVNSAEYIHSPTWASDLRQVAGGYTANFRYHDRFSRHQDWTTVLVIKKNTYHLQELAEQLEHLAGEMGRHGHDFATAFPTLILDDEADYASQNTNVRGAPPTIHSDIVRLREVLPRNTYIGYTATPQACLSADVNNPVGYPKDFFWLLEPFMEQKDGIYTPRSYLGAWDVFWTYDRWTIRRMGRDEWPHYEKDRRGRSQGIYVPPLPGAADGQYVDERRASIEVDFLRDIDAGTRPMPASILTALTDFIIAAGIHWWRHWRKEGSVEHPTVGRIAASYPYVSAMMHLSETQQSQRLVRTLVQRAWRVAVDSFRTFDPATSPSNHGFRARWVAQKERTEDLKGAGFPFPTFHDAVPFMRAAIEIVERPIKDHRAMPYREFPGRPFVYLLNSSEEGGDLFYSPDDDPEIRTKKAGIFVGGNILSRGLTLEGLCVTVFGRASQMPLGDATLQMGRWFGHKMGMLDLVSIYLQQEVQEVMAQVAEADRYLRLQIKDAIIHGHKPDEVLLHLKNSPFFRITSPSKSAFLQKDQGGIGLSGKAAILEEPSFDVSEILHNLNVLENFAASNEGDLVHDRAHLFHDVSPQKVLVLLRSLKCPEEASQVSFEQYAEYIEDWYVGEGLPELPKIHVAIMKEPVYRRRRLTTTTRPTTPDEARASVTGRFGAIVGGQGSDGGYKGDAFLDRDVDWHRDQTAPSRERPPGDDILIVFYRLDPNYVTKSLYDPRAPGKNGSIGKMVPAGEIRLQPDDARYVSWKNYKDEQLGVVTFAAWTPSGGPMYDISTNRLIDPARARQVGREQRGDDEASD